MLNIQWINHLILVLRQFIGKQHTSSLMAHVKVRALQIGYELKALKVKLRKKLSRESVLVSHRKVLERRMQFLEGELKQQLQASGLRRISSKKLCLTLSEDKPRVVVEDVDQIPATYIARIEKKPDKRKIRQDLMQGIKIDGVRLVPVTRLIIREPKQRAC